MEIEIFDIPRRVPDDVAVWETGRMVDRTARKPEALGKRSSTSKYGSLNVSGPVKPAPVAFKIDIGSNVSFVSLV